MTDREQVLVEIEVSAGGRVKYRADGRIAYVSPLPCPYDYGSVPGTTAPDGDPQDAMVLGGPRARGTRVRGSLVGVVEVIDEGLVDDKWIVRPSGAPYDVAARERIERFFRRYVVAKRVFALLRRGTGASVVGIRWL